METEVHKILLQLPIFICTLKLGRVSGDFSFYAETYEISLYLPYYLFFGKIKYLIPIVYLNFELSPCDLIFLKTSPYITVSVKHLIPVS